MITNYYIEMRINGLWYRLNFPYDDNEQAQLQARSWCDNDGYSRRVVQVQEVLLVTFDGG